MFLGDIRLGSTLNHKFTTISSTGAPITLAGSPAVAAYPSNSTTEVTAGITLTVDFDARTGLHNVAIVASSGNGYATATDYALVLTAGTVDGVSVVGYTIAHFSIENRSALMPFTAGRVIFLDANSRVDVGSIIGTAQTGTDLGADIAAVRARLSTTATKTGTVVTDAGNSATSFKTDLTETTNDHYKDSLLKITSGTLAEQVKKITAYNGTTKVVTVQGGFTSTPADGVTFEIVSD